MNRKNILVTVFILVAIVQLYVPVKMILDKETVLDAGIEYKFKTAPVDPSDPFRGKYITLSYEGNSIVVKPESDWIRGEHIYVMLSRDNEGFSRIKAISKEVPSQEQDYFKAEIRFVTLKGPKKVVINYPFNRYYMEETKAYTAELAYRESQKDSSKVTYALVSVWEGEAVLKDVLIDGVSINEIVERKKVK